MSDSDDNDHRRRAAASLGVEDFVHRKGVTRALHEFRRRKDQKFVHKAAALRNYKRVMKQEGYVPGKGARRKRDEEGSAVGEEAKGKRQKRTDPLQKASQKAAQKQSEKASKQERIEQHKKQKQIRLKERRQRTQRHKQRTQRGQPIMKNIVSDILEKLERKV